MRCKGQTLRWGRTERVVKKQLRVLWATRADGVIPGRTYGMVPNVNLREVLLADFDLQWVVFVGARGRYRLAPLCEANHARGWRIR